MNLKNYNSLIYIDKKGADSVKNQINALLFFKMTQLLKRLKYQYD